MDVRRTGIKLHFSLLLMIISNSVISYYTGYGINNTIIFISKILFYTSGIVLFFYYFKPFKKKAVYFGFYIFFPIISFICWIFDSILGVLLLGFLFFMLPESVIYNDNDIIIYKSYKGLTHSCCTYEVTEAKFLMFKKSYEQVIIEDEIEFKNVEINNNVLIIEDQYNNFHKIPLKNIIE